MKLGFWKGWGKPFSIGVGNGVVGAGSNLLPFIDDFARSDGVLGNGWTGSTWAIASGKAINTPTLGAELLTNGNMETGDPPSSWTALDSTLDGVADERTGGAGAQSIKVTNSGANFGIAAQAVTVETGAWYMLSGWIKSPANSAGLLRTADSTWLLTAASTPGADWAQKLVTGRSPDTSDTIRCVNQTNGDGNIDNYDDVSLKKATGLIAIRNTGRTDQNITGTYSVLTTRTQLGVKANVSADGTSYLVAWIDGVNIRLEKNVVGTWTTLINTTQTPAASMLPQIKTHRDGANLLVDLLYNGAAVGTQQTVSDAEIVSNTYAGLFSTYSGNTIATFSAAAN